MNRLLRICFLLSLLSGVRIPLSAATLYVDVNNTNPIPPYADWTFAAQTIQDAVDAANNGDLILVTNGVYQTGGRVVYGALTNRVAVTKPVTLQSVNGPAYTFIWGQQDPYGPGVARCSYLVDGAVLVGFTLTNGGTFNVTNSNESAGAGVYCESAGALLSNCVLWNNWARNDGGGAFSGTLVDCTIIGNRAYNGGGAAQSTLVNSLVTNNLAGGDGGGTVSSRLTNCTLFHNTTLLGNGGGASYGILSNCMLIANSAPLGGGTYSNTLTHCALTNNYARYSGGGAALSVLFDCILCSNSAAAFGGGMWSSTASDCTIIGNAATNTYPSAQAQGGGSCQSILVDCNLTGNYALEGGGSAFDNVTNCTYDSNSSPSYGGGAYGGYLQNCLLTNNSAGFGGAVCGATLIQCTLSGNSAAYHGGGAFGCVWGGCDTGNGACILSNCLLTNNSAVGYHGTGYGGGAEGATLNNCTVIDNVAGEGGGGASGGTLNNCTVVRNRSWQGGGLGGCTANRCTIVSNWVSFAGGGALGGTLNNCELIGNSASSWGGGVSDAVLNNCTLVFNWAYRGGGAAAGVVNNCILYFNGASEDDDGPNYSAHYDPFGDIPCTLSYCCTYPLPTNGICNITNDPAFVNRLIGDFHLQTNSPCINSGLNAYAPDTTDLDGKPRIVGGTVDIGAYEFQSPSSLISYAWLQQFNLPIDGSADFTDPDGDHMNNWQEWRAGTDPTNPLSFLKMLRPTATNNPSAIVISWQSVSNRTYFLQRATNLSTPATFSTIQSNIPGLPDATSCTDTNALGLGPFFYRVGVH